MQAVEGTRCHHGAERTIRCLQLAQLFRSSQWAFTNAAATTLALSLTGGDSARVVRMMSVSISVASALELLFTPWIGRYMDRAGRKPLLVVAAAVKSLPYAMNVFRPSLLAIFLEGCIDSTAYQLYSLAESTLVADQIKDTRELTIGMARITSAKGPAQTAGFLLGGVLGQRMAFAMGAVVGLLSGCVVAFAVRDFKSVPAAHIGRGSGGQCAADSSSKTAGRPLALFTNGRTLRILTLSALADGLVDRTYNIKAIHAQQMCGLSSTQFGLFNALRGVAGACSGFVTATVLRSVGSVRIFSAIAHVVAVTQQLLFMVARRPVHLFLALPSMVLGEQGPRQSATMALHARAAEVAGLGVGASQASLRTMMSIVQMAMPLVYGQLFVWRSGAPWAVAAACAVLAQGIFALVSDGDVAAVENSEPTAGTVAMQ